MKTLILATIAVMSLMGQAHADVVDRTCEIARKTVKHYTMDNAGEVAVRMTAMFGDMKDRISQGHRTIHSVDMRTAWEDMMAYNMHLEDAAEGKPLLQTFITDVCE